ncbi:choice-of-anchor L domain-containing protein [Marinifilum sp. D737]|uniref:choice-of-anchor L domain-containing protein n=1 Tax=Marinifilum sp. D737 TaxID=2969628 RepID=UPI002274C35D|nr:choice-of-anchor L domain-containing protein [Marinifilum sp. D737]MCY1635873.1 choice-of-anchor L domain-containing protein [Marinifilum sp. D737]
MDSPLYTKFYFTSYFKVILIVLLLPFATLSVLAQTNHIKMGDASPVSVKTGDYFYDSGGKFGNYGDNENSTLTLTSPIGTIIKVRFTSFRLRKNNDILSIYDGLNTGSLFIGSYQDRNDPGEITSSSNSITFKFNSNWKNTQIGWEAIIEVVSVGASYCEPNVQCATDWWGGNIFYLSRLQIGSIDNSSNCEAYGDFSSMTANVVRGSDYTANIEVVNSWGYPVYLRLWVDWNQDGDFNDSNEEINVSDGRNSAAVIITIPENAVLGKTRMRVKLDYNNNSDPCQSSHFYGEVEDYTLNILPKMPVVSLVTSSSTVDENGGNVSITANLDEVSVNDITVNLGFTGTAPSVDYNCSNTIVIPAGSLSKTIVLTAIDNNTNDGDRDVIVDIVGVTNANENGSQQETITIVDDDKPSTASIKINTQDASIGTSPEDLVQNVLVTGCLTADNVTFTGDSRQIGYFNKGDSDFSLSEGVILSTGDVSNAVGPNSSDRTSSDLSGVNGDSDLNGISAGNTEDAAVLEFDFTPAGDMLQFRYVFASEEFLEFACGNFNDVFGFFLSGPGIGDGSRASAKNIALLPDGVTPVAINNVHGRGVEGRYSFGTYQGLSYNVNDVYDSNGAYWDRSRREFYYQEYSTIPSASCNPVNEKYYVDNGQFADRTEYSAGGRIQRKYIGNGGYAIEYDGHTVVLTATYKVEMCKTYHIKLAVGDVGDGSWDSAVFLEAKSFKSNEVTVENKLDGLDGDKSVMYRGCDKSYISFSRKENLDEEYTFHVNISGTAVNGVDYFEVTEDGTKIGNFPEDVTFAPGQSDIKIYYMASNEVSGAKDILFEVLRGCPCSTDASDYFRKKIDILDVGEIKANAISNVTCGGGDAISTIIIELKDGLDPLNYLYALDGGAFQNENKFQGTYTVGAHNITIKDKFSCSSKDVAINIPLPTDLKANAGADFEMCEKEKSRTLNGTGGIVYEWTCDKALGLTDMDLNSENPTISPNVPAGVYTYTLTVSDGVGKACESSDDVVVTIKPTPIINSLTADQTEVCSGAEINLTANVSNASNPTYNWNPSSEITGTGLNVKAVPLTNVLTSRTYTLEVVSDNNCSASQSVSGIQVNPNPIVSLKAIESNLCSDGTDGEISVEASGGTPRITGAEYDYLWSHNTALNTDHLNGLVPQVYTITVRDSKSCQSSLDIQVKTEPKPIGIFY